VLRSSGGSTCAERRAWLHDWFGRLADRLRNVRACCGHWSRVCSSRSVLTRLGPTAIMLDPPYPKNQGGKKSRAGDLYASDSDEANTPEALRDEILAWCRKWGGDPLMRVAVCGYEGDGYEVLVQEAGWREEAWKASGGYGNRSETGKANAARERIWFSPHCCYERTLFDCLEPKEGS
jgi:DNA adenine methylase